MENQFNADFGPADGHWTAQDREAILNEAFRRLEEQSPVDETRRRELWHEIVVDFHRSRFWGRTPTPGRAPKEKKPISEERKRWRLLFPYIWAFLQATIVMKLVIYYFGINSADDPSVFNYVGLGVGIFLSFASLIFFAWRHHRKMKALGLDDTE